MKKRFVICFALLFATTSPAGADAVLLGTTGSLEGVIGFEPNHPLAQRFSVTSAIDVSAINVLVAGFAAGPLLLQLTDSLGTGTTAADVLFETLLTPSGPMEWLSAPVAVTLDIGTYFVVMNDASGGFVNSGWVRQSSTISSGVGTIDAVTLHAPNGDPNFAPSSNFVNCGCEYLGLEIVGSPHQVPEPALMLLLASGACSRWLRSTRRINKPR